MKLIVSSDSPWEEQMPGQSPRLNPQSKNELRPGSRSPEAGFTPAPSHVATRTINYPDRLTPADVQRLQPILGNHTIQRLLAQRSTTRASTPSIAQNGPRQPLPGQSRLTVGPAKDRYEEEAERMASTVMRSPEPTKAAKQPSPQISDKNQGRHDLHRPDRQLQRHVGAGVIQRFYVTDPQDGATIDTTGNELVKDKANRSINYQRTPRANVPLRVSDDTKMAVPDTHQTKDFYATEDIAVAATEMLDAQNSAVRFEPTGAKIKLPGGDLPLHGIKPVERKSNRLNKNLGDAAEFVDVCIEMAHQVTRGRASAKGGTAILKEKMKEEDKVGKEKEEIKEKEVEIGKGKHKDIAKLDNIKQIADFKSPSQRGDEFRKEFPAKDAQELGINQYASPEMGDMIATLNLLHRPDFTDFEYHFAGVVAKSGADYVTLENYNREGEDTQDVKEFFDELMRVEKYKNQYTQLVENLRSEYLAFTFKGLPQHEIEKEMINLAPKILATAERQFWQALEKAQDVRAAVTSNVREQEVKDALWYFQMYGPPDKSVTVDKITKEPNGRSKTTKQSIDQSFHSHMVALDEFGEPLTLRLEGNIPLPSEETGGIDHRVETIREPRRAKESSGFLGFSLNLDPAWSYLGMNKAKDLKDSIFIQAKSGKVLESQVSKLEEQLATVGDDGQHYQESAYALKIMRLEWALQSKIQEINNRTTSLDLVNPLSFKKIAKMSPRHQRALEQFQKSKLSANYQKEVETYRDLVMNTINQDAYQTLFPKEYAQKLRKYTDEMVLAHLHLDSRIKHMQEVLPLIK